MPDWLSTAAPKKPDKYSAGEEQLLTAVLQVSFIQGGAGFLSE